MELGIYTQPSIHLSVHPSVHPSIYTPITSIHQLFICLRELKTSCNLHQKIGSMNSFGDQKLGHNSRQNPALQGDFFFLSKVILAWGLEARDCQGAGLDGKERVSSGSSRVGLSVSHSGTSQLSGMSASRAVDPGKVDPSR